jgi:hypothetical protein
MKSYYSTGQSPQRVVAPTEEEEEDEDLIFCRSIWPGGLRHSSEAARFLGLQVRIPPGL